MPAGTWPNSRPGLQHSRLGQVAKNGIDIAYFKKNMLNSATRLIEKVLIGVAAFDRLNQFDLNITQLNECRLIQMCSSTPR
jgi:Fic family protein